MRLSRSIIGSNANDRPAVGTGGSKVNSTHGLSLLHTLGGVINHGAQGQQQNISCIRLKFLHKIFKWMLLKDMDGLELLDHILQDSFANGSLRHSPGVHQCGLTDGGGGGGIPKSPFPL